MKILITGHKGFLGTLFIEKYSSQYDIVGYDLVDSQDIADFENLSQAMQGCEQVVHLAAIPRPVPEKHFAEYMAANVRNTGYVASAAVQNGIKRMIHGSSTTIYGIERGIPFQIPITESQPFVSQYLKTDDLSCRECDMSYHTSKVMAEQIIAWYGLNKKLQTVALRFGPIGKVFLGTSVSEENAADAIHLALQSPRTFGYEAFSIVDDVPHIDISKARELLGYNPKPFNYPADKIRSTLEEKAKLN